MYSFKELETTSTANRDLEGKCNTLELRIKVYEEKEGVLKHNLADVLAQAGTLVMLIHTQHSASFVPC